jgi:hypothetical protein
MGLGVLAAALLLGVVGDALMRETPWGLNATLWTLGLVCAASVIALRLRRPFSREAWYLLGTIVVFAIALSWRDSEILAALDLISIGVACSLATLRAPAVRVARAGLADYAAAGGRFVADVGWGLGRLLLRDVAWSDLPRGRWATDAFAAARGVVLALPVVAVFGALFVAADATFEQAVIDVLGVREPMAHLIVFAAWTYVAAGTLRALVVREANPPPSPRPEWDRPLGIVEAGVVLGALNVLFAAFVVFQFRYFFGGRELVLETAGLTYAEYARRGFFELVLVAVLLLPLLLAMDWLLRRERPWHVRLFRALSVSLVLLLFVVMASALDRMRLYRDAYGLTELRLYATAFMIWLAVVAAWLVASVLRGFRERFAVGMLVSGLVAVLALHAVSPDSLIARTNIDRELRASVRQGELDLLYLLRLSDDATPALVEGLPRLARERPREADTVAIVADSLLARARGSDWRTWNWSRVRARDTIREHEEELRRLALPVTRL